MKKELFELRVSDKVLENGTPMYHLHKVGIDENTLRGYILKFSGYVSQSRVRELSNRIKNCLIEGDDLMRQVDIVNSTPNLLQAFQDNIPFDEIRDLMPFENLDEESFQSVAYLACPFDKKAIDFYMFTKPNMSDVEKRSMEYMKNCYKIKYFTDGCSEIDSRFGKMVEKV